MVTEAANPTDADVTPAAESSEPTAETLLTAKAETPKTGLNAPLETETPKEDTAEPEKKGAPESYEFKAHDDFEFDAKLIDSYAGWAKEQNLSQDVAQSLLDKIAPELHAQQQESVRALHEQWKTESEADKEIGGAGLPENLGLAKKVLDAFGTPEVVELFNTTGLGNQKEIIRLLSKVGKAMSDDKIVTGEATREPTDAAHVMFPGLK
jgi:hypothetical protein